MNLLITTTSLKPAYGGPATTVSRLAAALAAKGVGVTLWSADGSAPDQSIPAKGIARVNGGIDDVMRGQQFDLVHDNGIWLAHNHRVAALAHRRSIPRVVSTHGMLSPWALKHKRWKKRIAWRLYQRRDLDRAASCHVASQTEALQLRELRLAPAIVEIPNGMDIPEGPEFTRPRRRYSRERTALFMGRIYPVKGLPLLIEAWSRLRPKNWRLVIAGPDEAGHRGEIERAVIGAGLSDCISFAGELVGAAKTQAFLAADLFILPSHSESFGMVIAEALAHGVPVICTNGAPWPQLVANDCGWWCDISADALAEALRDAASQDDETLMRMGQRGRALIRDRFGWDTIADRMLASYAALVRRLPVAGRQGNSRFSELSGGGVRPA